MRIAYLDCLSGISGDMFLGALIDAGVDLTALQRAVSSLGLPECRIVCSEVKKKGFRAVSVHVEHPPEHAHRHLHHITEMIASSALTPRQQELACRIFTRLGEAEAKVHGTTLQKVHFHEVGAIDSIADIVGAAVGFDLLGLDRLVCSPIPTGTGTVEIAHGRVSIPAPATAELLVGVPLATCDIAAELTTPTGAAIVATLVDAFGPLPAMTVDKVGYGAGDRDLETQANVLRMLVGQQADRPASDQVWVLETNLDDTSGEILGYCTQRLAEAGALDVFTTAIQMKKGRPAVKLSVLCRDEELGALEAIMFAETPTLGIRRWPAERHLLDRRPHAVSTPWGTVTGKLAVPRDGRPRFSPEYESCRALAQQAQVPLADVYRAAQQAFDLSDAPPAR